MKTYNWALEGKEEMSNYRCCIFDLDGTIINTLPSLSYTISLTMKQYGYGDVDEEHTKVFVGDGYQKLVERALIYRGDETLIHYEDALKTYDENFKKYCLYRIKPYEGMPELLAFLKEKGIKLCVVTNKGHDRAMECVEKVYGRDIFDVIIGEGHGVRRKPDPSGALMAAGKCAVKPSECLYFGDTNTDMRTAKNAGMDAVGVLWGFRAREELAAFWPKYLIERPEEIREVF